jgi:hypothetical protein
MFKYDHEHPASRSDSDTVATVTTPPWVNRDTIVHVQLDPSHRLGVSEFSTRSVVVLGPTTSTTSNTGSGTDSDGSFWESLEPGYQEEEEVSSYSPAVPSLAVTHTHVVHLLLAVAGGYSRLSFKFGSQGE